jgi:hypothetical protein
MVSNRLLVWTFIQLSPDPYTTDSTRYLIAIIYSAALTYNTHHQELRALQFSVFPWLHEAFGPWSSLCEVLLAVYSGYGVYLAVHQGASLLIPFLLLYTLGFAAVAGLSLYEGFQGIVRHK